MFRKYRHFDSNEQIVVGVDTAAGGIDYVSAQFLSKTHKDVPMVYHSRKTTTEFTNICAETLNKIHKETGIRPTVAYERNNGGVFEMDRLASMNYQNSFDVFKMPNYGRVNPSDPVRLGWDTNSATRPQMLQDLKNAIDNRTLVIYDKQTVNEMLSFVVVQTSSSWKAQAENGAHDDLVMSLAIAWQLYRLVPTFDNEPIPKQNFDKWRLR